MIQEIPDIEDWIIRPAELDDVERALRYFDMEFYIEDQDEQLRRYTRQFSQARPVRVGYSRVTPMQGLGALALLAAMVQIGTMAKNLVDTIESEDTPRRRRRRRTALCYKICMSIVADSKAYMRDGWEKQRGLTTDAAEKRRWKKFRSRK